MNDDPDVRERILETDLSFQCSHPDVLPRFLLPKACKYAKSVFAFDCRCARELQMVGLNHTFQTLNHKLVCRYVGDCRLQVVRASKTI
jgi:hypothetical protein